MSTVLFWLRYDLRLRDYDVSSNRGNWLWIVGRGTAPRGGRRFSLPKQAQEHNADGSCRPMWGRL